MGNIHQYRNDVDLSQCEYQMPDLHRCTQRMHEYRLVQFFRYKYQAMSVSTDPHRTISPFNQYGIPSSGINDGS